VIILILQQPSVTIENLIKTETIFSLKMRVFQRVIRKNSFTGVLDLFYAWI